MTAYENDVTDSAEILRRLGLDHLIQAQNQLIDFLAGNRIRVEQLLIIFVNGSKYSRSRVWVCSRIEAVLSLRKRQGIDQFSVCPDGDRQALSVSESVDDFAKQVPVRNCAESGNKSVKYWEGIFRKRESRSDWLPGRLFLQNRSNLRVEIRKSRLQLRQQASNCSDDFGSGVFFISQPLLPTLVGAHPNRYKNCRDRAYCLRPGRPIKGFSNWYQINASKYEDQSIRNSEGVELPKPSEMDLKCFHRKILA